MRRSNRFTRCYKSSSSCRPWRSSLVWCLLSYPFISCLIGLPLGTEYEVLGVKSPLLNDIILQQCVIPVWSFRPVYFPRCGQGDISLSSLVQFHVPQFTKNFFLWAYFAEPFICATTYPLLWPIGQLLPCNAPASNTSHIIGLHHFLRWCPQQDDWALVSNDTQFSPSWALKTLNSMSNFVPITFSAFTHNIWASANVSYSFVSQLPKHWHRRTIFNMSHNSTIFKGERIRHLQVTGTNCF